MLQNETTESPRAASLTHIAQAPPQRMTLNRIEGMESQLVVSAGATGMKLTIDQHVIRNAG